jgi:membrane-associated phospholipid phosphatase
MTATAPDPPEQPDTSRIRRKRIIAVTLWCVGFGAWWVLLGLPLTDPILAFVWLWLATIAIRIDQPRRVHLRFARDWLPIVALLVGYNLSRGLADQGRTPHAVELIDADRFMFGGNVPTVWLQQHLYDPNSIRWYDVMASWVYFSHFVVALGVAVVLWLRRPALWAAFMRRWFALSALGLITYFAYPAAPPWWASKFGLLADDVVRISTRGWQAIGLHGAGNVLNAGQWAANPVAAMPSLHTAFALFVVVYFFGRIRRRWWPLLLAYPAAMTFTLIYTGEHYMIDVLVGWVYVGLAFALCSLGERWWRSRSSRSSAAGPPSAEESSSDATAERPDESSAARADRDDPARSPATP